MIVSLKDLDERYGVCRLWHRRIARHAKNGRVKLTRKLLYSLCLHDHYTPVYWISERAGLFGQRARGIDINYVVSAGTRAYARIGSKATHLAGPHGPGPLKAMKELKVFIRNTKRSLAIAVADHVGTALGLPGRLSGSIMREPDIRG